MAEAHKLKIDYFIIRYYELIDYAINQRDKSCLRELLEIFDEKAIYNRAGQILNGKSEIQKFYLTSGAEGRFDMRGIHKVTLFEHTPSNTIITRGTFTKNSGQEISFADFWELKNSEQANCPVTYRETYLAAGSNLICGE